MSAAPPPRNRWAVGSAVQSDLRLWCEGKASAESTIAAIKAALLDGDRLPAAS